MKIKSIIGGMLYQISSFLFSKRSILMMEDATRILEETHKAPMKSALAQEDKIIHFDYDLQIIIPAYNVEKYIGECLESVFSQKTKYKILVVVINDGSTDNTLNEIKKYTSYDNLVLIDQENKGFSGARNVGLKEINAKYIMFLDSDDYLLDNAIEHLLETAYEYDCDIVEGGSYNLTDKLTINTIHKRNGVLDIEEMKGFPWMKVIRSSLFFNLYFPEGYWFEDSIMAFLIYPQCKKLYGIKDMVYVYRQLETSISHSFKGKKKTLDTFYITEQLLRDCQALSMDMNKKMLNIFMRQVLVNELRLVSMEKQVQEAVFIKNGELLKKFDSKEKPSGQYKELYRIIKKKDFGKFLWWCKTHRP